MLLTGISVVGRLRCAFARHDIEMVRHIHAAKMFYPGISKSHSVSNRYTDGGGICVSNNSANFVGVQDVKGVFLHAFAASIA